MKNISFLEKISTIAWFAMDACWKLRWMTAAYILAIVATILMGYLSLLYGKDSDMKAEVAHLATTSWLLMNVAWMMSEVNRDFGVVSDIALGIGTFLIIILAIMDRDALGYFKRFRGGK